MRHEQFYLVKVSDLGVQVDTEIPESTRRNLSETLKKLYGAYSTKPTWFVSTPTHLLLKDSGCAKRALELYFHALSSRGYSIPYDLDDLIHELLSGKKIVVYTTKQIMGDVVQRIDLFEPTNFIKQIFGEST